MKLFEKILSNKSLLIALASVITRIFDPFIVFTIVTVLAICQSFQNPREIISLVIFFLFTTLFPPLIFFIWALKSKKITNWDVTKREERILPLFILSIFLLVDIIILYYFAVDFLLLLFVFYAVFIFGFMLISMRFKLSGHTAVTMLGGCLVIIWYGINYWPVLLFAPLVAWTRVVRKDHTLLEVIMGALYSFIITSIYWFYQ